jgi:hypothetical protein
VAQSNSNIFDLPVFDPAQDWIALEEHRAARVESTVGGTHSKSGAMHAAPFSRL